MLVKQYRNAPKTCIHARTHDLCRRGSARIDVVKMAKFALKTEKLSHIITTRGSQDLWSSSPIMAPAMSVLFQILRPQIKSPMMQFRTNFPIQQTRLMALKAGYTRRLF